MLDKGHLGFGSQENLQIFYFLKLLKNSLPHPLFSMLSELLSPSAFPQEEQLRWTLRKTKLREQDAEFEAAKNPP